jgi:hypothetical protein
MREQLRPLLDRTVHTIGTVARHCQRPEGHWDVLLTGVEVRPFDPAVPLLAIEPIVLEHLWLKCPSRVFPLGARLTGLGVVHLYARAGGSIDLGVRHSQSVDLGHVLDQLIAHGPALPLRSRLSIFEQTYRFVQQALAGGTAFLMSEETAPVQAVECIGTTLQRLARDVEANDRRLVPTLLGLHRYGPTRRERRQAERKARRSQPSLPVMPFPTAALVGLSR